MPCASRTGAGGGSRLRPARGIALSRGVVSRRCTAHKIHVIRPVGSHQPSLPPVPDWQDMDLSGVLPLIHRNKRFQILGQAGPLGASQRSRASQAGFVCEAEQAKPGQASWIWLASLPSADQAGPAGLAGLA